MEPKDMKELFEKAERDGLWLLSEYQGLVFSPKELRQHQADGRFRWGGVNWNLIDPKDELRRLENVAINAAHAVEQFKERMKP